MGAGSFLFKFLNEVSPNPNIKFPDKVLQIISNIASNTRLTEEQIEYLRNTMDFSKIDTQTVNLSTAQGYAKNEALRNDHFELQNL